MTKAACVDAIRQIKMRRHSFFLLLFLVFCKCGMSQKSDSAFSLNFPIHLAKSKIAKLSSGDSIYYYQCSFIDSISEKTLKKTSFAFPKTGFTLTEKLIVKRKEGNYFLRYYVSTEFFNPNKKFAYLKLTEKPHWNFTLLFDTLLTNKDVLLLAAYESKLQEVTEYDLTVKKRNSPQIILVGNRISNQYRVSGNYLLRKTLSVFETIN